MLLKRIQRFREVQRTYMPGLDTPLLAQLEQPGCYDRPYGAFLGQRAVRYGQEPGPALVVFALAFLFRFRSALRSLREFRLNLFNA